MSKFSTLNKKLAVKPIEYTGPKTVKQGGLALMASGVETITTELMFDAEIGDGFYMAGSKVVFLGEAAVSSWNKAKMTHDGIDFVLAPFEQAIMISAPDDVAS
jgi:hypothetical protein